MFYHIMSYHITLSHYLPSHLIRVKPFEGWMPCAVGIRGLFLERRDSQRFYRYQVCTFDGKINRNPSVPFFLGCKPRFPVTSSAFLAYFPWSQPIVCCNQSGIIPAAWADWASCPGDSDAAQSAVQHCWPGSGCQCGHPDKSIQVWHPHTHQKNTHLTN